MVTLRSKLEEVAKKIDQMKESFDFFYNYATEKISLENGSDTVIEMSLKNQLKVEQELEELLKSVRALDCVGQLESIGIKRNVKEIVTYSYIQEVTNE